MSKEISLSVEETNKLRLSLGLKPIELESKNSLQQTTSTTTVNVTDDSTTKQQELKIDEPIWNDSTVEDTDNWLENLSSKVTKTTVPSELQHQSPKKEEEEEVEVETDSMMGMKIGHSMEEINGLKQGTVLILKDRSILDQDDDEGDELVAQELVDKQNLKNDIKARFGKDNRKFKGYFEEDADDNDTNHIGVHISAGGIIQGDSEDNDNKDVLNSLHNKRKIVLTDEEGEDDDESKQRTDYQEAKPIKIKKLKKLKNLKNHKRLKQTDDEINTKLEYVSLTNDDNEDMNNDDDELQSILASLRKKNNLKKKKLTPEEFVTRQQEGNKMMKIESDGQKGGLVIDELSEFLSSIKKEKENSPIKQEDDVELDKMSKVDDSQTKASSIKEESTELKIPIINGDHENSAVKKENKISLKDQTLEEDISTGLGSTLKLLQQRAILSKQDSNLKDNKQTQREIMKQRELIELQRQKLSKKTDIELLRRLDLQEQELLKNYNPAVDIKYHDQNGATLSTKEAYKQMSHQFHGKTPSNNRMDKMLKKRQQRRI